MLLVSGIGYVYVQTFDPKHSTVKLEALRVDLVVCTMVEWGRKDFSSLGLLMVADWIVCLNFTNDPQ